MALSLEPLTGSDLTLDRDNLTTVRKFRVRGTLPYSGGGDAFDTVSSLVMGLIKTTYATYDTPIGTLFWNSIQLHESYYGQSYEISVTYSPFDKTTGTYLIRVEHAAGTAKATAGELIATYPDEEEPTGDDGVFFDGQDVVPVDVPYNSVNVVVSYRHPQSFLNAAYVREIASLAHHPNNDTFLGYDPGEICYTGGNFTQSECEASAEYTFEVSRNATDLEVGGITVSEKKGFDVLQPVYKWDTGDDYGGATKAIRPLDRIKIIRPVGREWKDYVSVFGWGG